MKMSQMSHAIRWIPWARCQVTVLFVFNSRCKLLFFISAVITTLTDDDGEDART